MEFVILCFRRGFQILTPNFLFQRGTAQPRYCSRYSTNGANIWHHPFVLSDYLSFKKWVTILTKYFDRKNREYVILSRIWYMADGESTGNRCTASQLERFMSTGGASRKSFEYSQIYMIKYWNDSKRIWETIFRKNSSNRRRSWRN